MPEFDIEIFSKFRPPRYLCPRCLGISSYEDVEDRYGQWPDDWGLRSSSASEFLTCPVCKLKYKFTKDSNDIHQYLERWNCVLNDGEMTERFKIFASVVEELRTVKDYPQLHRSSLRCLFRLLNEARCFVHFLTWGMSWDFIGMLALLSHRVQVRGIVSRCDEPKAKQIQDSIRYGGEGFEVIPLTLKNGSKSPHQKLLVIDGLIAITGSTNLTINAWDNVDKGLDHVVVETKPAAVMKLNNTLFSPVWASLHPLEENTVLMHRLGRTWMESAKLSSLRKKKQ